MSSKPRPSARGRGSILRPTKGEDHSPTPGSPAVSEKSGNREIAKSRLMKVGVQVDPDVYYEIKKRAAAERRKLYQVLDDALRQYLERPGGTDRTT